MSITFAEMVGYQYGSIVVPPDVELFITNQAATTSTRGTPYLELIIQLLETDTAYTVFNNALKYLGTDTYFVTTNNADELVLPTSRKDYYKLISKNDKRFYTCDAQLYASIKTGTPTTELVFRFKGTKDGKMIVPSGNQTTPNSDTSAYALNSVNRTTIFTYNAGTTIYLLIDYTNTMNTSYGYTVWIMQSYANQVLDTVSFASLPLLYNVLEDSRIVGRGNTIPRNWAYTTFTLPRSKTLQSVSIGTAYLVQDGLKNSYTYLDPEYGSYIYNQVVRLPLPKVKEVVKA